MVVVFVLLALPLRLDGGQGRAAVAAGVAVWDGLGGPFAVLVGS